MLVARGITDKLTPESCSILSDLTDSSAFFRKKGAKRVVRAWGEFVKQAMGKILRQVQEDAKLKEDTNPTTNYRKKDWPTRVLNQKTREGIRVGTR